MLTQLFYVTNWYHDRLFQLGFDEAAGNFQQTNFSGMGLGNDRVLAEGQDNTGVDNANFSTPPDGMSGRAQMYRFTGPTIDRDGSLDTEVLIHELTHGLSNRLIGDAAGLIWDPGSGMGEGWSDFYSLSLLNNTNADDPNGNYAEGGYATYKAFGVTTYTDNYVYGIRRFPYSTNNSVNPLTWADVDDYTNNLSGGIAADPLGFNTGGAQEVHNTGEVWCLSLWEVRSRIIAANGGDVPTGNQKMLQIVTDAMKLTPNNPSYEDARDALIDADCAANACANEQSIWAGFADRGLGYGARSSSAYGFAPVATHQGILESFSTPSLDRMSVVVDDSSGNNNGAIDPGEPIRLTVTLTNPWRNASKNVASATATLATSTAGVVIYDNSSTYGAIAAQGNAAGDTFLFTVPTNATCGQSLNFTVTTNSTLGPSTLPLSFRIGAPSGTAAPVTYTRTPASPLAILDNRPRGTIDSQTITDDYEIADLNVRIDSLPHTFPGDITFGFKAPNSYGVDVVTLIGGAVTGGGDGDNITNMVIDNQAVGDMLLATNAQAPYTGSWLPIANSPTWPALGFGPQEPFGELNKLNGASTLGTWRVLASDQAAVDTGTLNSWSLIVTPRAFTCQNFAPAALVTGTKTVSGTFSVGGTVTYTVTLTNNGTGNQADNPGNEFTDILPAQLMLVSASATSGTATTAANTVTWNGSLAPLGGSVTITITATIKAGAGGQTVSNQGTISYDSNNDNVNDATAITDDPSKGGANDTTTFVVTCSTLTCPANITVGNDPNQCGAVVNYPGPTSDGTCGTITCSPASGSFFPKGTTTVACNSTAGPTCSFTVTVNDTQAPTITCPTNQTVGTTGNSAVVTYPAVSATDNCAGVTVACTPPSGSAFAVGTTTVTCTASDTSANSPDATCSFAVTVNRVSFAVADPLACTGPGNAVTGTFTVSNNGAAATAVAATVTLPVGLVGVPGSGTANLGAVTVTNTTVTYTNPALAVNQTATVTYQAQVGDVPGGTVLTSNLAVSFGGGPVLNVAAQTTVNCPAVGPGLLYPSASEVSDQKAGSVLVFNYYTSDLASSVVNTRLSLTNTNPTLSIAVHLFFVDGTSCSIADAFVCLTGNQTVSLLASDFDPGTSGYVLAVASDPVTGCPVNFNFLIGEEFVKAPGGFAANLGAEALAALAGGLPSCNEAASVAVLNFDNLSYNRLPRVLAADSLADNASGNSTQLILNRISGNLSVGADRLGTLFGILYNDQEQPFSFQLPGGVCQLRGVLSGTFPRTVPRLEQVIPAGRTGWLRIYDNTGSAILGAQLTQNAGVGANAFRGGHNLHKLTLAPTASLTLPIFPPSCR